MQADVTVVLPGMYQVAAALFGKQKPTFHILVNGSIALRVGSHSTCAGQHTVHRAALSELVTGQHVSGTSVLHYLILPADACLTIVSPSQHALSQGFLSLQYIS